MVEHIDPAQLFGWASQAAMVGWLILILLPRRFAVINLIPRCIIPFGLALMYAGLILPHIYTIDGGGYGSLEQVQALFQNEYVLVAGWVHYLAFDLFIGAWIAHRSDELGISRVLQAVILLATFMFGPIGLALYFSMRGFYSRPRVAA